MSSGIGLQGDARIPTGHSFTANTHDLAVSEATFTDSCTLSQAEGPHKTHVMAETQITLTSQTEAQALFGPQDEYVRRLRKKFGVRIILRGSTLVVDGDADDVDRCEELLHRWLKILRLTGELFEADIATTLETSNDSPETMYHETDSQESAGNTAISPRDQSIRAGRAGRDKVASIRPKTPGQAAYMEAMTEKSLVFCDGPAGCGKTYLAVAMALQALRDEHVRKIVLVRPAVEAGEKLGFLPGDMFAKVNPFVRPLLDAINDMLDFDQVRRYMANDVIEIAPLAFMRGRTLNDTFMILDEGQNTTVTQMKMFLTRMGVNSRIVVTGDATQNDLPKGTRSGLEDGIRRLSRIDGVEIVRLTGQDIVRHRLVRQIVSAYEDGSGE